MIEVVDREVAPLTRVERGERGGAAGLIRKARARRPEHRRRCDGGEVELLARDVHVGRLRLAVEVHREAVRGEDLAEDERRRKRGVRPDPSCVDPELRERAPHVHAETIVADLRDDGGAPPEARGGDRDVGGAATQGLRERADLRQRHTDLLGVQVDADTPHGDDLEVRHASSRTRRFARSSRAAPVRGRHRASHPVRERTSLRSPLRAGARAPP